MIILQLSHGLTLISSCTDQREAISEKSTFKLKIQFLVLTKNLARQIVLVAQRTLKVGDSQGKNLGGYIITYIRAGVEDVSRRLAHEEKADEVTWLALDLLILLWAGGVVAGEVKVAKGSTRSGHDLLELLLVPKALLFLGVALVVVILLDVVILVGGVELLPLGAVGDEVSGVAGLEEAPRWSPPLLAELVQGAELSHQ
jgi:hypothetical protein